MRKWNSGRTVRRARLCTGQLRRIAHGHDRLRKERAARGPGHRPYVVFGRMTGYVRREQHARAATTALGTDPDGATCRLRSRCPQPTGCDLSVRQVLGRWWLRQGCDDGRLAGHPHAQPHQRMPAFPARSAGPAWERPGLGRTSPHDCPSEEATPANCAASARRATGARPRDAKSQRTSRSSKNWAFSVICPSESTSSTTRASSSTLVVAGRWKAASGGLTSVSDGDGMRRTVTGRGLTSRGEPPGAP